MNFGRRNPPRRMSALVVENDVDAREAHEEMLNRLGLETESASRCDEAISIIRNVDYRFNLILMGRNFPDMNETMSTRVLRGFENSSHIVGVSPHGLSDAERAELYDAGVNDVRNEGIPLSFQTMTAIVRALRAPRPSNGH